jgi:hypothetical protein
VAGTALAAWQDESLTVLVSRSTGPAAWTAPQGLDGGYTPRLAVSPDGGAVAVWINGSARYASYTPGRGWGPVQAVPLPEGAVVATVAADGTGGFVLDASSSLEQGVIRLWAIRLAADGRWEAPTRLGRVQDFAASHLAADGSGRAAVAWREGADLRVARFSVAEGWGPGEVIDSWSSLGGGMVIAIRGDRGAIVWDREGRLLGARLEPDGRWSRPEALGDPPDAELRDLILGPNGDALAVWSKGSRLFSGRWAAAAPRWSDPDAFRVTRSEVGSLVLGADDAGRVTAVWSEKAGDVRAEVWASSTRLP